MPVKKANIEVSHFLTDAVLNERCPEGDYKSVFINVKVDRESHSFKSRISEYLNIYRGDVNRISDFNSELKCSIMEGFFTDDFLSKINEEQIFPLYHLMRDELDIVEQVVIMKLDDRSFEMKKLEKDYRIYTSEVATILDDEIKNEYVNQLHKIFLNSINIESERPLFRIANFLIHFINWDNKFSNFYKSTLDLLEKDFQLIESHLNKELRTSIQAYLSFADQINILERFFNKRELGKISTLSYIDWVQNVKEVLQAKLSKVYGQVHAIEYIVILDAILDKKIKN